MNAIDGVEGSAQLNVVELLVERHARGPNGAKKALIEGDRALSYIDLKILIERASAVLAGAGVGSGDVVGFVTHDTLEAAAFLLATMRLGAIATYLNPSLGTEECATLLEHATPVLLLIDDGLQTLITPLLKRLNLNCRRLREGLETVGSQVPPATRVEARAPAVCLYSSGSTGRPKAVLHSHRDIINLNLNYAAHVLNIGPSDTTLSPSRMFFAYGFNSVHCALFNGGTAVLAPPTPKPKILFELIRQWRPTVFFGVPTLYLMMLALEGEDHDLTSLRLCVSAGEPLPSDVFDAWRERFGRAIIDGIGTTEALSTFISNTPEDNRPGSTGKLVPGFEVRLVAESGRLAVAGEIGTLWVRGNSMTDGYWRDPESTARFFQDGWFCTNDMFKRDPQGRFHYVGRANDMLKVGGCWVSPIAIEQALRAHEAVHDCAVVKHHEVAELIQPKAFVVLKQGLASSPEMAHQLKTFSRLRLKPHEYPHFIEFVPALPKTASGKTQRYKLRQTSAPAEAIDSLGEGKTAETVVPAQAASNRNL